MSDIKLKMPGDNSPQSSCSTPGDSRKSSKPIMEKKRRARINASLAELKSLLLEVMKKEGTRHSKMEKADILEMTVKHLRQIQRQQFTAATNMDPAVVNKYQSGFNECASEVTRYLGNVEGADVELRARLMNHLANCVTGMAHNAVQGSHATQNTSCSSTAAVLPTVASVKPIQVTQATACTIGPTIGQLQSVATLQPQETVNASPVQKLPCAPACALPQRQILQQPQHARVIAPGFVFSGNNAASTSSAAVSVSALNALVPPPIQPAPVLNTAPSTEQAKVFSGVPLIPTRLQSGEMAFVLPSNILPISNSPAVQSYIIPVYTGNVPQLVAASQQQTAAVVTSSSAGALPLNIQTVSAASGATKSLSTLTISSPSTAQIFSQPLSINTASFATPVGMPSFSLAPSSLASMGLGSGQSFMMVQQPSGSGSVSSSSTLGSPPQGFVFGGAVPRDEDMWRPW